MKIESWLSSLGLEQYAQAFAANDITWDLLPSLSDADLRSIGVESLGHRRQLLAAIGKIGETPGPRSAPAPSTPIVVPVVAPTDSTSAREAAPAPTAKSKPAPKVGWKRFTASNAIVLSIILHLVFGVGATYFIVQRIQAKRKLTFTGGPPTPNPSTRALEHKINMARRQQTMSAPAQAKRIVTTGLSKVALPDMPAMPSMSNDIIPTKMAGQGGQGVGLVGASGAMGGTGGAGGGSVPLFGAHRSGGGALVGRFYDLKQDNGGHPNNLAIIDQNWASDAEKPANAAYIAALNQFCRGGWNEGNLSRFFKGPEPLYATQIFIPMIDADEGPKAFNLEDKVKPRRWIVLYKGNVTPSVDGKYRFVGFGDDVLTVRFNNRVVLDSGYMFPSGGSPPKAYYAFDGLSPEAKFNYFGCGQGEWFDAKAGNTYPFEAIIGECPGNQFKSFLLLQKDGADAEKDSHGNPKLPIFKVAPSGMPTPGSNERPMVAKDTQWSVWKVDKPADANDSPFGNDL